MAGAQQTVRPLLVSQGPTNGGDVALWALDVPCMGHSRLPCAL